jgi:hypothetical protein
MSLHRIREFVAESGVLCTRALDHALPPQKDGCMCNLYSLNKGQDAIRKAFGVERDETGNLPPLPGIFPDQMAPVVRLAKGTRELAMVRWGIPGPKAFGEHPVTNVRNVKSPHWRPWLKPEYRCLVPATSFSEYTDTKPGKTPVWFALSDERPRFALAGRMEPPASLTPETAASGSARWRLSRRSPSCQQGGCKLGRHGSAARKCEAGRLAI